MTDQKPPRRPGDCRTTLTSLLQYQRTSIVRKLVGLDEEEARRSPVPTGTSLLWLVHHLIRAEALWILRRFAGEDLEPALLDDAIGPANTVASVVDAYRAMWSRVDAVVAEHDLDERCVQPDAEPIPDLRWVLAHLLQETARHAGHADILRELVDGDTGR